MHGDHMGTKIPHTGIPAPVEDRFVAFIDILGFQDLVRRMIDEREWVLFETIKASLESILKDENRIYDPDFQIPGSRTRQMTSFSDCVVISDLRDEFFGVLLAARSLYIRLLFGGILCRGAIARGLTYHAGRVVFGEGPILAYKLESQAAVYPRIIVTDEVNQTLAARDAHSRLNIKFSSMLAQDNDGLWFIDPFAYPLTWAAYRDNENPEEVIQRALGSVRERIVDGLTRAQNQKPLKVWQIAKHKWLARRFNMALTAEGRSEPTRIEI
jgi:hypothetical protein